MPKYDIPYQVSTKKPVIYRVVPVENPDWKRGMKVLHAETQIESQPKGDFIHGPLGEVKNAKRGAGGRLVTALVRWQHNPRQAKFIRDL